MTADTPDTDLERLHAHLEATETLPMDRTASHWIGEAQAIVADLRQGDPAPATVADRVATVADLLENVDTTDHEAADRHLVAARECCRSIRSTED